MKEWIPIACINCVILDVKIYLGKNHSWFGGGARAKAEKKSQQLLTREKKTQLNNSEEKTHQLAGQEKNSSANWPGKKTQHDD